MLKKTLLGAAALAAGLGTFVAMAQADEMKVFRVGILGGENEADRLKNYQCISDQVGKLLNVEVKLFPAADYDGVIQGLLGGTLDFAELGAAGYAKVYLADKTVVDPILTTAVVGVICRSTRLYSLSQLARFLIFPLYRVAHGSMGLSISVMTG